MILEKYRSRISAGAVILTLPFLLVISGCMGNENTAPTLSVTVSKLTPAPEETVTLEATVYDEEGDNVTVTWTCDFGILSAESGTEVTWKAPSTDTQICNIRATANDGNGGKSVEDIEITVTNLVPNIASLIASSSTVLQGNTITLTCVATDPNGGAVAYAWSDDGGGTFTNTASNKNTASWRAPTGDDVVFITVTVTDAYGGESEKTIEVLVYSNHGVLWVADSGTDKVYKFSAIGKLLLTAQGVFKRPIAIATNVDEFFGCYIADYELGQIIKVNEAGTVVKNYQGFIHPIDVDIFRSLRQIWVLDVGNNSVTVIDGYNDEVIGRYYGLNKPRSLKVNQETGDVWITDTGNNRIVRILLGDEPDTLGTVADQFRIFNGTSAGGDGYSEPIHLSFSHHTTNTIYIADISDDQVETIRAEGNGFTETSPSEPYDNPSYVAVSEYGTTDIVWVIHNTEVSWLLNGSLIPETIPYLETNSFRYPYRIISDDLNGKIWLVDNGLNQIIPLGLDGLYFEGLDVITGFVFIEDIGINL